MTSTLFDPLQVSFDHIEVLAYYDRPILLACQNEQGQSYLVMLTEEEPEWETWVAVKVTDERLKQVRDGGISLRPAFTEAESGMAQLIVVGKLGDDWQTIGNREIPTAELPDTCLPFAEDTLGKT